MPPTETPPCVLLIEDDALIAMELCDVLEAAGYRVAGPAVTTAEALALIANEPPQIAIVDVVLRDGPCVELAHELRRRRVPFLVHSGGRRDDPHAGAFQGVPWLSKPSWARDVVQTIGELCRVKATC